MAAPFYSEQASSDLLIGLKELGYVAWYVIDATSPNALYQVLAQGLISHLGLSYEVTQYLQTIYSRQFPNLSSIPYNFGADCLANPQYWSSIGETLRSSLFASTEKARFQQTISSGREINKSSEKDCLNEVLAKMHIALIWYEVTSFGSMTHTFLHEGSREPLIFVSIAQEAGKYYLLLHKEFVANAVKEGFPFFEKMGNANPKIPRLGDVVGSSSGAASSGADIEPFLKCISAQSEMIGYLSDLLSHSLPQQLPAEYVPKQKSINLLYQTIESLFAACRIERSLNTQSMQYVLTLPSVPTQNQSETLPVDPHTVMNCDKYLQDGPNMIRHGAELFCLEHLSEYLRQSKNPMCPRCTIQLPDKIIERAAPEMYQQMSRIKQQNTMNYQTVPPSGGVPMFSTMPKTGSIPSVLATSSCMMASNSHLGAIFQMNCGKKICASCLSMNQTTPGCSGFCPFCKNPMDMSEKNTVYQAQSSTFR